MYTARSRQECLLSETMCYYHKPPGQLHAIRALSSILLRKRISAAWSILEEYLEARFLENWKAPKTRAPRITSGLDHLSQSTDAKLLTTGDGLWYTATVESVSCNTT